MDENKTFHPEVLFVGGDGQAELVAERRPGDREGRRPRARQEDHDRQVQEADGLQAAQRLPRLLSQVEIETIGKKATRVPAAPKAEAAAEDKPKAAPKPKAAADQLRRRAKPAATQEATTTKKKAE